MLKDQSQSYHVAACLFATRRKRVVRMLVGQRATSVVLMLAASLAVWRRSFVAAFPPSQAHRSFARVSFAAVRAARGMSTSSATETSAQSFSTVKSDNPLLQDWSSEAFHLPPFSKITVDHYAPALEVAQDEHLRELQAIVDTDEPATFENIIQAYDQAGSRLEKVQGVFSNMCSSQNTPELQKVQLELTPILSRHSSKVYTLPGLFEKIETIYKERANLSLNSEQVRLVERIRTDFVRMGAMLPADDQATLAELNAELATLRTTFQQTVLQDEANYYVDVTRDELEGCPDSLIEAASQAAKERSETENSEEGDKKYIITLARSMVEPLLTFCPNREVRERVFEKWSQRGSLGPSNNLDTAKRILQLRHQKAQLYGYKTFAEYQCEDRMAKTPEAVMELLETVWEKAKASANRERKVLEDFLKEQGGENLWEGGIQPWDWRYVAEQVRKAQYDMDETLLKPYLSLEGVRGALLAVSGKLFGLSYKPRPDLEVYHPDVDVYEVRKETTNKKGEVEDKLVAIFLHDNYARAFKGGGAWMSEYRSQTKNLPTGADSIEGVPIVSNNNNFSKGGSGKSTLLSYDDAVTMFHEMGHAHHGMLSDATYSRLASTNVLTDFVELPSQLMEHWFESPQVLQKYAKHYETGEPIPMELVEKLKAAQSFNQGFGTIEYTICALMDMLLHHTVEDYESLDLEAFEREQLQRLGMPQGIIMRHRPSHFLHLFASEMYASGYYVYLWAEVLDADAFGAFEESGDIFNSEVAEKARKYIYAAGNTEDPQELFRRFRGRDPDIQFMLKKKGLMEEAAS